MVDGRIFAFGRSLITLEALHIQIARIVWCQILKFKTKFMSGEAANFRHVTLTYQKIFKWYDAARIIVIE